MYYRKLKIKHIFWGFLLVMITEGCEKALDLKSPDTDPVAVFEEVWHIMDKQYALFNVKQADWKLTYNAFRPRIAGNLSEEELFSILGEMLETLKDGHVVLFGKSDTSGYDNFYKSFPVNFNYRNIVNRYLNNDYKSKGPFQYKIVENVGYLYYRSFSEQITDDDINFMINEMNATKGLILDLRSNPGGNSSNVNKLASWFVPEKRLVKYELIKNGPGHDDFFDPRAFYVSPAIGLYDKPVALLTNRSCFSACNDFALYMSGLEQVTIIGDQTGGGGSVPQNYLLSNGWKLQFSATITLSPLKQHVENGILPDVYRNISPIDELNGSDPIIDRAFAYLK
jgi:hypothetical protein